MPADPRANDVTNAKKFGRNLSGERAAFEGLFEYGLGNFPPEFARGHEGLVSQAQAETGEDCPGADTSGRSHFRDNSPALLSDRARFLARSRLQHLGTGRAFRVFQDAVLSHNQGPAQGDHHQNAQQAAEQTHEHDPRDLQIETEDQDRRHRHAQAKRNRFTGGTRGLDNVVLENGGIASAEFGPEPEQGERNHRHWDRRANRQPDFENQVKRRRPENHPQQRAHDQRAR